MPYEVFMLNILSLTLPAAHTILVLVFIMVIRAKTFRKKPSKLLEHSQLHIKITRPAIKDTICGDFNRLVAETELRA